MAQDYTQTRVFNSEDLKREVIRNNLMTVAEALEERGYNAVHQIAVILFLMILLIFQVIRVQDLLFSKLIVMKLLKNL